MPSLKPTPSDEINEAMQWLGPPLTLSTSYQEMCSSVSPDYHLLHPEAFVKQKSYAPYKPSKQMADENLPPPIPLRPKANELPSRSKRSYLNKSKPQKSLARAKPRATEGGAILTTTSKRIPPPTLVKKTWVPFPKKIKPVRPASPSTGKLGLGLGGEWACTEHRSSYHGYSKADVVSANKPVEGKEITHPLGLLSQRVFNLRGAKSVLNTCSNDQQYAPIKSFNEPPPPPPFVRVNPYPMSSSLTGPNHPSLGWKGNYEKKQSTALITSLRETVVSDEAEEYKKEVLRRLEKLEGDRVSESRGSEASAASKVKKGESEMLLNELQEKLDVQTASIDEDDDEDEEEDEGEDEDYSETSTIKPPPPPIVKNQNIQFNTTTTTTNASNHPSLGWKGNYEKDLLTVLRESKLAMEEEEKDDSEIDEIPELVSASPLYGESDFDNGSSTDSDEESAEGDDCSAPRLGFPTDSNSMQNLPGLRRSVVADDDCSAPLLGFPAPADSDSMKDLPGLRKSVIADDDCSAPLLGFPVDSDVVEIQGLTPLKISEQHPLSSPKKSQNWTPRDYTPLTSRPEIPVRSYAPTANNTTNWKYTPSSTLNYQKHPLKDNLAPSTKEEGRRRRRLEAKRSEAWEDREMMRIKRVITKNKTGEEKRKSSVMDTFAKRFPGAVGKGVIGGGDRKKSEYGRSFVWPGIRPTMA